MTVAVIKKRENHIRPPERGYATCGQCGSDLSADRNSFRWRVIDEGVEEKARRAHGDSQSHLHNLHFVSWEEASEETREFWRAKVAK